MPGQEDNVVGQCLACHKLKSSGSIRSVISDSQVTPGSLEIWSDLPAEIKNDPSLAPFKNRYQRQRVDTISKNTDLDEERSLCENQNDTRTLSSPSPQREMSLDTYYTENTTNPVKKDTTLIENQNVLQNEKTMDDLTTKDGDEKHQNGSNLNDHHEKTRPWVGSIKISILLVFWLIFTALLLTKDENPDVMKLITIPVYENKSFYILENPIQKSIFIQLDGPFSHKQHGNITEKWINVWLEVVELQHPSNTTNFNITSVKNASSTSWQLSVVSEDMIDSAPDKKYSKTFELDLLRGASNPNDALRVMLSSNLRVTTPLSIRYNTKSKVENGLIYAAGVLMLLYILIIFEIVHRTFAAMLASTLSIGILAMVDQRPSTAELISWIDMETLLLLFSMMVIVAILSETGIFDYLAVYAYKVAAGRVWTLINCLCLFTFVMSAFLDNVTALLLMTPVTIRLCEVMELNPVPILISMVIFSNMGGTCTPIGDPPNVIIASNARIQSEGIDFTTFTLHMSLGIFLVMIQTYSHLRLYFRGMNGLRHSEPKEVRELRREISVWKHAAASLSSYSKDEDLVKSMLMKKVNLLFAQLKKTIKSGNVAKETYRATLQELSEKYPIRNKVLLVKSTVAVTFVILLFFLHSIPELQRLSLGWTALLGALLLLILADRNDLEAIMARVEWPTLIFFASLFILMEALSKLGLINWIGKQTEDIILSVSEESRLAVAILLILWVSALASAFVDNIPLTTMMLRIALDLGCNPALNLPLQPLIWALSFGACLGGNGTLIGASANVVCAGVAEQHGYRFSFLEYFKIGFPIMLGSIATITAYLIICHVAFGWH